MVGQVAARAEPEVAVMGVQAVAYGAAEPRAEVGSRERAKDTPSSQA